MEEPQNHLWHWFYRNDGTVEIHRYGKPIFVGDVKTGESIFGKPRSYDHVEKERKSR